MTRKHGKDLVSRKIFTSRSIKSISWLSGEKVFAIFERNILVSMTTSTFEESFWAPKGARVSCEVVEGG